MAVLLATDAVSGAIAVILARAEGNVRGFGDEDEKGFGAPSPPFASLSNEVPTSLAWAVARGSLSDLKGPCHCAGARVVIVTSTAPMILGTNDSKLELSP